MSQFDYAKDTRSEEDYKRDVETGILNENVVCSALKEFYGIDNRPIKQDEQFTKDFKGKYRPDRVLKEGDTKYFVEVKVSLYIPLKIDFKKNQIDRLCELKGKLLYATDIKFGFISSGDIIEFGEIVSGTDSKVNHEAYRVGSDKIGWTMWPERISLYKG